MTKQYFTILFEGNVKDLPGDNPFKIKSPFGRPITIGASDVFEERDRLERELEETRAALAKAKGQP